MAEDFVRIRRWDNGELVEDYMVPKLPEVYNAEVLHERAVAALVANKAFVDTPLGSITQADAAQQIKALSRQNNGIIRLLLSMVDDISDTE